ncbi:MAG: MFS transporter [Singulisphaera sp.]
MRPEPFRWPLIALLTCVAAVNYGDRMAISAVYPLLRADLGVSDAWLGALGSAFLWSYAAGSPVAGWIADRVPRSGVILVSLVSWSVVTLATGLVRDANELLVTRVLLGLTECAYLPAAAGLLADHHGPDRRPGDRVPRRGWASGRWPAAAGYLGERHGWRSTFVLLGIIGLILAFIAFFVLRGKDSSSAIDADQAAPGHAIAEEAEAPPRRNFLENPGYWVLLSQSMVVSVGVWLFLNWLPLYLAEAFRMSLAAAGFLGTMLIQMPGMIGVIVGGYFSDLIARRGVGRRMLFQSVCYFLGAPLLLAFAWAPALPVVAGIMIGFSLLRSLAAANENPLLCDLLSRRQRSTAIGLWNTANCTAGGIGVISAGFLKREYGLGGVFAGASGLILLSGIITAAGYLFVLPRDLDGKIDGLRG